MTHIYLNVCCCGHAKSLVRNQRPLSLKPCFLPELQSYTLIVVVTTYSAPCWSIFRLPVFSIPQRGFFQHIQQQLLFYFLPRVTLHSRFLGFDFVILLANLLLVRLLRRFSVVGKLITHRMSTIPSIIVSNFQTKKMARLYFLLIYWMIII